nr:MAG TPA: minor capsid protein [Caudoviricetes sp.]
MGKRQEKGYWDKRVLKDKARDVNNAEKFLQKNQKALYAQAAKEIQQEIEKLYGKFADQQNISIAEARQLIRGADFRKIDWQGMIRESMELREKIRAGKGTLPEEVIEALEKQHKELEDRMAAYTKRGQISYLELRQVEIERKLVDLYDKNQQNLYEYLHSEYEDGYYRQVYNTQQHVGVGYDFVKPSGEAVDRAILNRYDRRNFSKTLYQHCEHFAKDLRENLVVGLIRGESLERMAARIRDRMGVAYSAAKRLVRTETAYIYEQATKDAYEECGVEWYEFLATLDGKTSEICRELDGKHFKVRDAMPGKNYPPMHPNCRSTTVVWFPGEEEKKKTTSRIAKDGAGKYYEVPADMTYKQWYGTYVEGKEGDGLKKVKKGLEFLHDELTDLKTPVLLSGIPYAEEIRTQVENNDSPVAKYLLEHYDDIKFINLKPKGNSAFYNNEKKVGIRVDVDAAAHDKRGRFTSLYHEIGHYLDSMLGNPSAESGFADILQEEADMLIEAYVQEYGSKKEGWRELAKACSADVKLHSLSDIMSGATKGRLHVKYRHQPEYWEASPDYFPAEAWAHFAEAELSQDLQKQEALKECFPSAYRKFLEVISDGDTGSSEKKA